MIVTCINDENEKTLFPRAKHTKHHDWILFGLWPRDPALEPLCLVSAARPVVSIDPELETCDKNICQKK